MKSAFPRLVVAGLRGGSGKTTLSLGLIAAWREKGHRVVPYKKGPDYIDAGWLASAAGRACYNLDPFMIGGERVLASFRRHFGGSDCAVIEGNRGLYDGMDAAGTYSTAELARILKAPVVLIMDCTKVTRTSAAMILGMQKFDRRIAIEGVVLNRIAGTRHEKIIRETVEKYCKLPVVGAIPKLKEEFLSERHMGLTPFQEHPEVAESIFRAAEIARKYLDLDRLWKVANDSPGLRVLGSGAGLTNPQPLKTDPDPTATIGIIRDSAFQFYYPENFEELERRGARLIEVSALTARSVPDVDALYIGGGFPETNAISLAKNRSFRKSLLRAVEGGLPVYAECGGLMYLGDSLLLEGRAYPMTGIFPIKFCLEKRPQAHGYTVVETGGKNPFYEQGLVLKGHEFHYSRPFDFGRKAGVGFAFRMKRGQGLRDGMDGITYKNVLATYTHLHAYGAPEWADGMIRQAVLYRRGRVS